MKLIKWIEKESNGEPPLAVYKRLAKAVGRKSPWAWRYIYFIALGRERPGQDMAVKLVQATGGEVSLFELLPHLKEAL